MDITEMDEETERMIRRISISYMCAVIGKFMLLHREEYGSNPAPWEITDFCFHVSQDYRGHTLDINTEISHKFIINCMEKARTEKHATEKK